MYISFFRGRKDPSVDMEESYGYSGPVLVDVQISYAYGNIRIHPLDWEDILILPELDGLIKLGDDYYSDFEVWETNHNHISTDVFINTLTFDKLKELIDETNNTYQ